MKVTMAILADAATVDDATQKVFIHGGGITEIRTRHLPAIHPQITALFGFQIEADEASDPVEFDISVYDPEGNVGPQGKGGFKAKLPSKVLYFPAPLPLLMLKTEGHYEIRVTHKGETLTRLGFDVIHQPDEDEERAD